MRVNHSEAYGANGVCTNMAEGFFSRLCCAEIGIHRHIRKRYLDAYASEMAWRKDNRREGKGAQYGQTVHAAMHHPVNCHWKGH
jgi:ISXO2-like transposase domain